MNKYRQHADIDSIAPRPVSRKESALGIVLAVAIGIALGFLAVAWFST